MRERKRWFLGGISGFFFGLALSIMLAGLHVVKLDSPVLTVLPAVFLLVGFFGALAAPRRKKPAAATTGAPPPDVSAYVADDREVTGATPTPAPPTVTLNENPGESPPSP